MRSALESRMEQGVDLPLTVVTAPAGYGKSTLLSHWLETSKYRAAWLSLDESDNDLQRFLYYFITAIQEAAPSACQNTLEHLEGDNLPPEEIIVSSLGNELHLLKERVVLVVDDYQHIRSIHIHSLLDRLLQHPPRGLHLVIASRQDPPLSLSLLRGSGFLSELRMTDLEFTNEESTRFLKGELGKALESEIIDELHLRTEGWPVGIRLAALALKAHGDAKRLLNGFGAKSQPLQQYLLDEVLSAQPEHLRERLLQSSILDRFNAELCEAVWHRSFENLDDEMSGREFIDSLESVGLFCVALDDRQDWNRYHHLFSDFLLQQLKDQYCPEDISRLHLNAAHWYRQSGHEEEAIKHALAGHDHATAADIVGLSRHRLMNQEKWHQLERWLRLFSQPEVESHLQLLLLRCWLDLAHWYRLDLLMQDLDLAERLLEELDPADPETSLLLAEHTSMKSSLAFWMLDSQGAVDMCAKVAKVMPDDRELVQDTAIMVAAGAHQMLGQTPEGEQLLWSYLDGERSRSPASHGRLLQSMCYVHWMNADNRKLSQTMSRLLEISLDHQQYWNQSFSRYFLGLAHYDRNELEAAILDLEVILERPYRFPIQNVMHCSFLLAMAYQAKGKSERALEISEEISKLAQARGNRMFIELTDAFQAELDLRQGRLAQANYWATTYEMPEPHALHRYFYAEFTYARILLARGAFDQLGTVLQSLAGTTEKTHHRRFKIDVLALKALMEEALGNEEQAVALLQQAVVLAQPGGLVRPLADLGPGLIKLLNWLDLDQEGLHFVGSVLAVLQEAGTARVIQPDQHALLEPLSNRELDVLKLLAENLSNREVGEKLFISPGTVKRHAHNIYGKLAVSSRNDAVSKAYGLGLLKSG
ncbi:MAG: hypothetical protein GQ537_05985 [Gammaproteobacteria bacterium]|nr:hypothetical protein [Gammaproteobacteria bacterium]